uniref:PHD-type domain-containing protein n=1 Tax=Globodera pallida TaxID=36090 RepID=A0A183CGI3_GLOPA
MKEVSDQLDQISSNNIPSSSTEREGPLENGTQQTVEQSLKTEEVNANWTMLEPSRSNRRCKIVVNKNISKTLTNGRRPIVGKNGSGGGFSIKAASVGKSARKGNGQQRQSDRTLKEKTPKNAYFDCTCKQPRGINNRRETKRIPFWQCADCKKQQKEGDEEEIKLMFCVCREPYDNERFYVGCDGCGDWYHPECVQTTEEEINALGEKPYSCPGCKGRPQEWFDAKMTTKTERDD